MESKAERAQGYRREAEKYAQLAGSGQRDITSFVQRRLAERYARMAEDLERRETLTNSLVTAFAK
jgi:hypothetical protein